MRAYSRQTLEQRFWPKVRKGSPDECWDWKGARTGLSDSKHRYGYLGSIPASSLGPFVPAIRAHRASWLIHHGVLSDDRVVCHRCDRPLCVNPAHLFLGTKADNNRDRIAKGRDGEAFVANHRRGFANPNAKLTPDQVREMRDLYNAGGVTQTALAERYGVKQAHVSRIVRGESYLT